MAYFGCRTVCNKVCWGLFGVAMAIGAVLLSTGAGTYATCHSQQRHSTASCYQSAAAVMVAGAIVLVLGGSCPLYMSTCCAQPPALDSKDIMQSGITVVKPERYGKASVYHYSSSGQLTSSPGVTTCTAQRYTLEHPAGLQGGNLPSSYLQAPAFHHHTINMQQ